MGRTVAVIGCGPWGKNLVRCFEELGALHTICDVNPDVARELGARYRAIRTTDRSEDVFRDPAVKAVVIAAPAAMHYELTRRALLAGKDVFVEKPLALQVNHGRELERLAYDAGRMLMVGHVLQYHPAIRELKRMVSEGELGRLRYLYSNRLSFGKIRREENILWSFAPHDISVLLSIMGQDPIEVIAKGSNHLHPEIADVTVSHLRFDGGVDAHIFVSWLHPFKEQKLVVIGDRGMAVFDDTSPWGEKLVLYSHEVLWKHGFPEARKAEGKPVQLEEVEPLREECRHFLESVERRTQPLTSAKEGVAVLGVLNALQESLDRNGATVQLTKAVPDYFVHETAIVDQGARIGKGSKIWHFAHVLGGAEIGVGCSIGQNVVIMSGSKLGRNVKVQNNVSVYEKVVVEDDVFLGPSMVFTNVVNPRSHISRKHEYLPTVVRRGATIGANATIVCGHEIGEYAFIGSGAVVTKSVPGYALFYGNPARQHGWMCQCGVKLPFGLGDAIERTTCTACGALFERKGSTIRPLSED